MAKEFTYRGKTLEELKNMDTREFAKLVRSREKITILKNFEEIEDFVKKCKIKTEKNKSIRTHKRDLVIVPKMIGYKVSIYNGKQFVPVDIIPEMLGHRFGEFSLSRNKIKHGSAGLGATKSGSSKSVKK